MTGYIYVRNHTSYDEYDACKLGKTNNIPERDSLYATGEIKRGIFELVIEMSKDVIGVVEKMLQKYFSSLGYHIYHDGGIEFYKRAIIPLIVPYLQKTTVQFKVLSRQEIEELVRCNRKRKVQEIICKAVSSDFVHKIQETVIVPRPDQARIVDASVEYLQTHDKGLLVLMCGVGKTLISLWIAQKILKTNLSVVIGVPNKLLLEQWHKVVSNLFQGAPVLLVSAGVTVEGIHEFLVKHQKKLHFVITTYSSSYKVSRSLNVVSKFGIKILDEVHHLTTRNMRLANTAKTYVQMLNIPAEKQIALTATLKQLESSGSNPYVTDVEEDNVVISNDDIAHFGEVMDRKNLLWAINNDIICDYVVQTIVTTEEQLEKIQDIALLTSGTDKRLFLSAYAALKSINDGHSHHLLIYANSMANSLKIVHFISLLLENKTFELEEEIYFSHYDSDMTLVMKSETLRKFENARFGIISCVYCLGEGWDFPLLDAVVFGENMTSNIRIVQSALRASRKNKKYPNKKAKIILPIFYRDDDWLGNDNLDMKKVCEVIYFMGLEDETIVQKIVVSRMEITKQTCKRRTKLSSEEEDCEFLGDYDDELTQKLRLKTTKRSSLVMTYEKTRKILVEKNIKSKDAYYDLCKKDTRLSPDPEMDFRNKFTNWVDFLSIERGNFYYDLDACKSKVKDYLSQEQLRNNHTDLAYLCSELCKSDPMFPPCGLWVDYYKVKQLQDIIVLSVQPKKKKGLV